MAIGDDMPIWRQKEEEVPNKIIVITLIIFLLCVGFNYYRSMANEKEEAPEVVPMVVN